MFKVKFADIGEGLTEGKVAEVLVEVGQMVKAGDPLFFVETDKVNSEIPAPVAGKIAKIFIKPDQEIKVGEVVMEIEECATTSDESTTPKAKKSKKSATSKSDVEAPAMEEPKVDTPDKPVVEEKSSQPETKKEVEEKSSQPEAKKEVEEENASVVGSTPVSNELIQRNVGHAATAKTKNAQVKATPLARKMAADLKIDLSQVTPSGPGQRILIKDLDQSKGEGKTPTGTNAKAKSAAKTSSIVGQSKIANLDLKKVKVPTSLTFTNPDVKLEIEAKPMSGIRKATVKAMTLSHNSIAGFTGIRSIDVTELVDARAQLKPTAEEKDIKLTYLAFVVKAVAKALQEMPNVNVQIDEKNQAINYIKNINIGIAVDTPDGLIVPVIKQADKLSVLEIAVAINDLATKAKNKKLTMKDISEATFTITNFGSVGLEFATPIINAPEAAILGMGTMSKTLAYVNDSLQTRMMMPFSMTADHRIIDGADAGRFLLKLDAYLQDPVSLLNDK